MAVCRDQRYRILSHLARKYLCIPATSVRSERLFSMAGNIITAERFCRDPENVNRLCFLRDNLLELKQRCLKLLRNIWYNYPTHYKLYCECKHSCLLIGSNKDG